MPLLPGCFYSVSYTAATTTASAVPAYAQTARHRHLIKTCHGENNKTRFSKSFSPRTVPWRAGLFFGCWRKLN
jgi:hypothetical protein